MTATDRTHQTTRAQLQRLASAVSRLRAQVAQRIVGQEDVVDGILTALLGRRPRAARRRPRARQDAHGPDLAEALELSFSRVQFTPDLMPGDITGTEIIEEDPTTGKRAFRFVHGPGLRQRGAGRRDQPHAAQDPGRAAPGDAGAPGHRGGQDLPAARSVLRAGHPEPDRAGGHLSPARGPARPLHARAPGGYPEPERGRGDRRADHRQPARRIQPVLDAAALLGMQELVRRIPVSERPDPGRRAAGADDPAHRHRCAAR